MQQAKSQVESEQRTNVANNQRAVREMESVLSHRLPALHRCAIEANHLNNPDDLKAAIACVDLRREIANNQRLCRTVRCAECGGDHKLRRHGMAAKHRPV